METFGPILRNDLRGIAQVLEHLARARIAVARIALDRVQHDLFEMRIEIGIERGWRLRIFGGLRAHHVVNVGARVRQVAGQHLVENRAQRIDVGADIAAPAADLFGRHVVGRADGRRQPGPRQAPRRFVECDSEVHDLGLAFSRHQDVFRLQIAMHYAFAVHVHERLGQLARECERFFQRQPGFPHHGAQRVALDELHRDVHAAFLPGREDLDDAGMVQAAPDFFLALKAAVENHVALELHVGNFDRDGLAVDLIDGLEDRRHPAARDHLDQLVLIEVFTNADLAHCSGPSRGKGSADVNTPRNGNGRGQRRARF